MSLKYMLNRGGPNVDPCGTPDVMLFHVFYISSLFPSCYVVRALISKPHASNFAISNL